MEGTCLLASTYVSEAKGDQRRPEVLAGRVSLDWVGTLALELEQVVWYLPSTPRDKRQGWERERETDKNSGLQSLGHQPSSAVRGGPALGTA